VTLKCFHLLLHLLALFHCLLFLVTSSFLCLLKPWDGAAAAQPWGSAKEDSKTWSCHGSSQRPRGTTTATGTCTERCCWERWCKNKIVWNSCGIQQELTHSWIRYKKSWVFFFFVCLFVCFFLLKNNIKKNNQPAQGQLIQHSCQSNEDGERQV